MGSKTKKKQETRKVVNLAWRLFYLGNHKAIGSVSLYDRVINTATQIVGIPRTSSSKAYIAIHYDKLAAFASAHSKQITEAKRLRQRVKTEKPYNPQLPVGINAASDAFLTTYEWRRVRMVALKKYGARCQCCGASPAEGAVMNVDHIKPRKLFPQLALDVDNLQILCHDCNHGKGNWDMTDWRPEPVDPEAITHLKSIINER